MQVNKQAQLEKLKENNWEANEESNLSNLYNRIMNDKSPRKTTKEESKAIPPETSFLTDFNPPS